MICTDDSAQPQPQEGGGIKTDYSQLLSEGHVYDNEGLVVSQPNTAHDAAAGQTVCYIDLNLLSGVHARMCMLLLW